MVQELQKFLRDNNVDFETDPSTQQLEAAKKKQEEGEEEENEEEGRGEAEAPAGKFISAAGRDGLTHGGGDLTLCRRRG